MRPTSSAGRTGSNETEFRCVRRPRTRRLAYAVDVRLLFGEASIKLIRADVISRGLADRLDDGFRLIGLDALGFEFTSDAKRIE